MRILFLALTLLAPTLATAYEDTARPEYMIRQVVVQGPGLSPRSSQHVVPSGRVQDMIASYTSSTIGSGWVQTALRLAKIESGFRCHASNGRAVGLFQNTRPETFGISRAAARTCWGGVVAGIGHMKMCIAKGAHDMVSMMRCHNSGSPRGRVDRVYRRIMARA